MNGFEEQAVFHSINNVENAQALAYNERAAPRITPET